MVKNVRQKHRNENPSPFPGIVVKLILESPKKRVKKKFVLDEIARMFPDKNVENLSLDSIMMSIQEEHLIYEDRSTIGIL